MLKSSICAALLCAAYAPFTAMAMSQAPTPPSHVPPSSRPTLPQADTCGLGKVWSLIGTMADVPGRSRAETLAGHGRIRWITPGTAITQDFRADRLNLILDDKGHIRTLRCG